MKTVVRARRAASALFVSIVGMSGASGQEPGARSITDAQDAFARLPFHFEPIGARGAGFAARGAGYSLALAPGGATLALQSFAGSPGVVHLRAVGGDANATIEASDRLASTSNYFRGTDPAQWRSGVPNYGCVTYRSIYPGIDWVFHGDGRALEYDFRVAAGADPRRIELAFEGAERLELTPEGSLLLHHGDAALEHHAPRLWQEVGGARRAIDGRFVLRSDDRVAFEIGDYDPQRELVIDPTLVYGTFVGGSGLDWAWAIAVDTQGFVWLAGETDQMSFPTTSGAYDRSFNSGTDVFVCKLNPSGNTLVWSTFLGGSGNERGNAIAVDNAGQPFVTGYTTSSNFPTTAGVFDRSQNGGTDVFVAKLSANGSTLAQCTFLGGAGEDASTDLAIDPTTGITFVTGTTTSNTFPTTAGAFDTTHNGGQDAFVTKLSATFATLSFSTFVGGSGDDYPNDISILAGAIPLVAGYTWSSNFPTPAGPRGSVGTSDVFAFRLNAMGSSMTHAKVFGGTGNDWCWAATVDSQGNCFLAGATDSANFPTTAGAYDRMFDGGPFGDTFITKLDPTLGSILISTLFGSTGTETLTDITLDSAGRVIVVGGTDSPSFPVRNAIDSSHNGMFDAIVAVFNPTLTTLQFSSYFGSSMHDAIFGVGLDGAGIMYVGGYAGAAGFPTTSGAYDTSFNGGVRDAMAMKISGY